MGYGGFFFFLVFLVFFFLFVFSAVRRQDRMEWYGMGGNGITAYGQKGGYSCRATYKELFIDFGAVMDIYVIGGWVAEMLKCIVVHSSSRNSSFFNQ